jgi:hypothetical protein
MKPFKSTMVVHHPPSVVWATVRDHLPELVPYLPEVASVTTRSRVAAPGGVVLLVNHWVAKVAIPAGLASVVREDMLGWTDYAEWRDSTAVCTWRVEPGFHPDRVRCSGTARYEPAMGGRGTRVTFEGTLEIVPGGGLLGAPVARALESFISAVIPRNAQGLYRASDEFLAGTASRRAGTGLSR